MFFSLSESVTQERSQNLSILGSGGWRRSTDILLLIGMFHYLSPVREDGGFLGGGGGHTRSIVAIRQPKRQRFPLTKNAFANKSCNLCNHLGLGTSMV